MDHGEPGTPDTGKEEWKNCDFEFVPQLSSCKDLLSTCPRPHRSFPSRCVDRKDSLTGVGISTLSAFALGINSWMFNPASPGVVVGHMVVLTQEGLEAAIHRQVGFFAVAKVPFSNLANLIEKVTFDFGTRCVV